MYVGIFTVIIKLLLGKGKEWQNRSRHINIKLHENKKMQSSFPFLRINLLIGLFLEKRERQWQANLSDSHSRTKSKLRMQLGIYIHNFVTKLEKDKEINNKFKWVKNRINLFKRGKSNKYFLSKDKKKLFQVNDQSFSCSS